MKNTFLGLLRNVVQDKYVCLMSLALLLSSVVIHCFKKVSRSQPLLFLTDANTNPVVSTRSVTVAMADPDSEVTYQYTCNAIVNVSGLSITVESNTSIVTVRGPMNPVPAVLLEPTNITDTMATIQWIIPYISYTPETYIISLLGVKVGGFKVNYTNVPVPLGGFDASFLTVVNKTFEVTLKGLTSSTYYHYEINSTNTIGSSFSGGLTFTTAVPAPRNFIMTTLSSTVLRLTWDEPLLMTGDTLYYYKHSCSNTKSSTMDIKRIATTGPNTRTFDITALDPFTEYMCNLTATTNAGTSDHVTDTAVTGEAPPSAVRDLSFEIINTTAFSISWNVPQFPYGIITKYTVKVVRDDVNSTVLETVIEALAQALTSFIISDSFMTGIPYYVYVTATTGGGEGDVAKILIFTKEGTPAQVKGVTAERINYTAVNVSWKPLTLMEAAGYLDYLQYRVTLFPEAVSQTRKRQLNTSITKLFNSSVSSGVIAGLDGSTSYTITVVAVLRSGNTGPISEPIVVEFLHPTTASARAYVIGSVALVVMLVLVLLVMVIVAILSYRYHSIRRLQRQRLISVTAHRPREDPRPMDKGYSLLKLLKQTSDYDNPDYINNRLSVCNPLQSPIDIDDIHNDHDEINTASSINAQHMKSPNEVRLIQRIQPVSTAEGTSSQVVNKELSQSSLSEILLNSTSIATSNHTELLRNEYHHQEARSLEESPKIFNALPVPQYESIPFTDEGLFYHLREYGITIMIPPGAVQGSAELQFGATQLLQGFKSELGSDCYPVSPFVWIHTEPVLTKPAELYLPHYVDTTDNNTEIHLLTRNHKERLFRVNDRVKVSVSRENQLAKLVSTHFCSLCLATKNMPNKMYQFVYARKTIDDSTVFCDISVLYTCKCFQKYKVNHEDYEIKRRPISSFEELKIKIELPVDSGWRCQFRDFEIEIQSIKEEEVDFYRVLGKNPGDIGDDEEKALQEYEQEGSYPPSFKISFNRLKSSTKSSQATAKILILSGSENKLFSIPFDLKGNNNEESDILASTIAEASGFSNQLINPECVADRYHHQDEKDRLMVNALEFLRARISFDYFKFGHFLGIPIPVLQVIEENVDVGPKYSEVCLKNILLHWRNKSIDVSVKAITKALEASGYPLLAAIANSNQLHDKLYDGRKSDSEALSHVLNSSAIGTDSFEEKPDLINLDNLVVARIPARWMEFGIQLGIELSEMEAIKMKNLADCKHCFIELLDLWRQRCGSTNHYTWSTVIKVLHSPSLKEYLLAEEIYKFLLKATI